MLPTFSWRRGEWYGPCFWNLKRCPLKSNWIITANRAEAKLFLYNAKDDSLTAKAKVTNPLARLRRHDLETDAPGWSRARYSGNVNPHALTGEKDTIEQADEQFAAKLADWVESRNRELPFRSLLITAEPKFLGRIKKKLIKKDLAGTQIRWSRKDLTKAPTKRVHRLTVAKDRD